MLLKSEIDDIKKCLNNEILTDSTELYCYAEDATNTRINLQSPDVVIFPETVQDVQKVVKYANERKIPIIARGAGTNMVGACTCPKGGIVLNFSKMNKILDFNTIDMTMTVQPGVVLDDIKKLAVTEGLFYPPDPSNFKVSTIGGSIAQSSGGAMGFKYGTTKDYILSLTVVLADGSIMKFGAKTIKDAVGYHLNQLIIGSEGTLAIVVEAELKLIPKPEAEKTILVYYSKIEDAVNGVNNILKARVFPSTIDFMDKNSIVTVENFKKCGLKTDMEAMLLINIDGFECSMEYQQELVKNALESSGAELIEIAKDEEQKENIWAARRASFAATAQLAPDVVTDDIIVPRSKIAEMIVGTRNICDKYGLSVCMVGHLGDGNIHPQVALDLNDDVQFKNFQSAKSEIYKLVVNLGGTISAEHGIGIEKIDYFEELIGNSVVDKMRELKQLFDPNNILNPNKIFNV